MTAVAYGECHHALFQHRGNRGGPRLESNPAPMTASMSLSLIGAARARRVSSPELYEGPTIALSEVVLIMASEVTRNATAFVANLMSTAHARPPENAKTPVAKLTIECQLMQH